jgi:hypothetical protein
VVPRDHPVLVVAPDHSPHRAVVGL